MWNYREYILRLFYEREIRNKARLQLKQEKKHEIYSDVEETLNKKQDLENEKKMVNIGCVRCDNTKCQLYSSSQILLKEIQKNLREKMQQKGGFNAEEMSEAENLVSHCKCIEEWDKYEEVLKSVELTCKNCGHELLNNTVLTPRADIDHSSSRKTFYLKKPINVPKNSHLMLALNSFNSPYSFYLIREGVNDSFTISTDDGVTVIEQVITIPEGYEEESTYVYISASTWTAPYIADISGSSCLYVAVKHRGIQNQNMAGVDGVLQKINIEVLPLEYIYFKPIEMQYFETSSEHINHFDISILDENFKEIEFNGGIWRIGFTIHYNYNKEVILDDSLKELLPKEIDEEKKIKELEERKKELEEEKKELVKKKQTKEKKTKNKKNS